MQWQLLDFSATISYVLPTKLHGEQMHWLLDFSVTIKYVLDKPTKLPRANAVTIIRF